LVDHALSVADVLGPAALDEGEDGERLIETRCFEGMA